MKLYLWPALLCVLLGSGTAVASPPEAQLPPDPPDPDGTRAPATRPAPQRRHTVGEGSAREPATRPAPQRRHTAGEGSARAPATRPAPQRRHTAGEGGARERRGSRAPEEILNEANNRFSYGQYDDVVRLLRPLVERDTLSDRDDRLEALRLHGICLYLTGRKPAARRVFETLLRIAPETRLDPRLIQPEVVAEFDAIRKKRIRVLRKDARRKLERRWAVLNLIPPVGQFQNGQWRKAVIILSLEVGLLAANIATYYLLRSRSLRQPDHTYLEMNPQGEVTADHRPLARALMGINYASLGLLLGTVVYGMTDGFIYHFRQKRALERMVKRPLALWPAPLEGGGALVLGGQF